MDYFDNNMCFLIGFQMWKERKEKLMNKLESKSGVSFWQSDEGCERVDTLQRRKKEYQAFRIRKKKVQMLLVALFLMGLVLALVGGLLFIVGDSSFYLASSPFIKQLALVLIVLLIGFPILIFVPYTVLSEQKYRILPHSMSDSLVYIDNQELFYVHAIFPRTGGLELETYQFNKEDIRSIQIENQLEYIEVQGTYRGEHDQMKDTEDNPVRIYLTFTGYESFIQKLKNGYRDKIDKH